MREARPRAAPLTLAPTFASSKSAPVMEETKTPPRKWIAVAPGASARKVIESTTRLKLPATWVESSMPRAEPVKITLLRLTTPELSGFSARPRPREGESKVLLVTLKFTLPSVKASAEPAVFVATNTMPPNTVPVEPEMRAAVEPCTYE